MGYRVLDEPPVVLTVFFEGTANTLQPITTQVGIFFDRTEALDVTDPDTPLPTKITQLRMGFDGCGVTNGMAGVIFAAGLTSQCAVVTARVRQILAAVPSLTVNVLGLSRGGIGALLLAQQLSKLAEDEASL